jgi:retron-type reverse transcriptase
MDNSNRWKVLKYSFPIHNEETSGCWRAGGRAFYSSINLGIKIINSDCNIIEIKKTDSINNITNNKKVNLLIAGGDLNKEHVDYNRHKIIIDKLATLNLDKCGKYLHITKEFLCDPMFLKFSYNIIKKNKGVSIDLDGINNNWFETAAALIKNSQYNFKPAKRVAIPKPGGEGKTRVFIIINGRDQIIQKATAILLESIYEKQGLFHEESYGFRPNKSCHTALQQIKFT